MENNPETLKYNLNQIIEWFDESTGIVLKGTIVNIGFEHLDVIYDKNKYAKVSYSDVVT